MPAVYGTQPKAQFCVLHLLKQIPDHALRAVGNDALKPFSSNKQVGLSEAKPNLLRRPSSNKVLLRSLLTKSL